jgi:toxin ParE1/3/4
MQLRWTAQAFADLEAIWEFISKDSPASADKAVHEIYNSLTILKQFPHAARRGRVERTRELIIAPYVAIYEVEAEAVQILRVIHSARRWP